jgi:hypothetical protein
MFMSRSSQNPSGNASIETKILRQILTQEMVIQGAVREMFESCLTNDRF